MPKKAQRGVVTALVLCLLGLFTVRGARPASATGSVSSYRALSPARVLDTREDNGHVGKLAAGETVVLDVSSLVPANADAVVLNVTVTEASGPLYITVWGSGERPWASSLNANGEQTVANLVTTPVLNGMARMYTSGATHLVADLSGYYAPVTMASSGRCQAIGPTRVLDTRGTNNIHTGMLSAGEQVSVDLTAYGVPADAAAAVVNLTVTDPACGGYLTAYPDGMALPYVSSLNVDAGQTVANQAIVTLTGGRMRVFTSVPGQLIVDLSGYFTGGSAALSREGLFMSAKPARVLDTRSTAKPPSGTTLGVALLPNVKAYVTNLTLTDSSDGGYVSAWPGVGAWPGVSSINASRAGQTVANHAIVNAGPDGFALTYGMSTHFIVDLVGLYVTGSGPDPDLNWGPPIGSPPTVTSPPPTSPPPTTAPAAPEGPAGWVPASSAAAPYAFLFPPDAGLLPMRWNKCADLGYLVNLGANPPAGALDAIATVAARVKQLTGINMVFKGTTTLTTEDYLLPANVSAVIKFKSFTGTYYAGLAGYAGFGGVPATGPGRYGVITRGSASFNTDINQQLVTGWGAVGLNTLVAHEIGHMLGLDHVLAPTQVMFPVMVDVDDYGQGDKNGLAYLYAAPCSSAGASLSASDVPARYVSIIAEETPVPAAAVAAG